MIRNDKYRRKLVRGMLKKGRQNGRKKEKRRIEKKGVII